MEILRTQCAGDSAAGFGLADACAMLVDLLDCDAETAAPILWADRMLELETCANDGKSVVDEIVASHVVASMGNEMGNEPKHEFDGTPV